MYKNEKTMKQILKYGTGCLLLAATMAFHTSCSEEESASELYEAIYPQSVQVVLSEAVQQYVYTDEETGTMILPMLKGEVMTLGYSVAPENVTFAGFVDRETLREAYCGADVFAFMSHEETEGIVVLEALACGIPTVVRDIPVYAGWLRDGKNVYKADSTAAFRQRVTGLLDGTLPDLTEAGRRVAEERSMAAMGEQLREVYRRMEILPEAQPAAVRQHHVRA